MNQLNFKASTMKLEHAFGIVFSFLALLSTTPCVAFASPATFQANDTGFDIGDLRPRESGVAQTQHEIQLPNPNQHDRLFQALHAAEILADIGSLNEAVRIVAAIANFDHPSPPVEEARRRLERWGLSPESVRDGSPEEIRKLISDHLLAEQNQIPDVQHWNILLDLEAYDEASEFLAMQLQDSSAHSSAEKWRGYLQQVGQTVPKNLQTPDSIRPIVDSIATQRQLWRAIQKLWLFDHHCCELALQLWQRGHEGQKRDLPFHHDHERPWPELLRECCDRAASLQKNEPQHAKTMLTLVVQYGNNEEMKRYAEQQLNQLSDQQPSSLFDNPEQQRNRSAVKSFTPNLDRQLADDLFESPEVLEYELSLEPLAAERLRIHPRDYVRATFRYDGKVYSNVGVRLKGGAGSFRPFDGQAKVGLTIKFNEFNTEQRFHGLKRIVLNNAVQDASYLNEFLGYGLFREAGLPAPRVTHASLTLNGQYYGLYVQPEAVTKDFLRTWFGNSDGNLYEGPGDVLNWEHLDLDTNQQRNDRSDLLRLVEIIHHADNRDPWPDLQAIIDPRILSRFMVIEQLAGHWDGFAATNNYRIYHSPDSNHFTPIPHGADQLFENLNESMFRGQASILGRAIQQTESGRQIYIAEMRDILLNVWDEKKLKKQILEIYRKLHPILSERQGKGHNQLSDFRQKITRTIEYIELRRAFATAELKKEAAEDWRTPRQHIGLPSFLRQ